MTNNDKWNIHWEISRPELEKIIEINSFFLENYNSEINFRSGVIPHITLMMGKLRLNSSVDLLRQRCIDLGKNLKEISVEFNHPYLEDTTGHYIFMDPVDSNYLKISKNIAQDLFGDLLEPSTFGGSENPSHLTVGYVSKGSKLEEIPFLTNSHLKIRLKSIGLSQCGPRGTCFEPVFSIPVVENEGEVLE